METNTFFIGFLTGGGAFFLLSTILELARLLYKIHVFIADEQKRD